MTKFCADTMNAISTLAKSVDGAMDMALYPADGFQPKGKEQECDVGVVPKEWVDQYGPGFAGDDFHGTVSWDLGSHFLVVQFST